MPTTKDGFVPAAPDSQPLRGHTAPMAPGRRAHNYFKINNAEKLTSAQRRRLDKKARRWEQRFPAAAEALRSQR